MREKLEFEKWKDRSEKIMKSKFSLFKTFLFMMATS